MSTTVLERIQAKVCDVLASGLPAHFPDVRVERNRDTQVQAFPTVNVLEGALTPIEPESTGVAGYLLDFAVEIFVQTETSDELGPALNDLYGRTVQALKADRTLGGLAIDLKEEDSEVMVSRTAGQRPTAARSIDFVVQFWTAEDDPYSLGPGAA